MAETADDPHRLPRPRRGRGRDDRPDRGRPRGARRVPDLRAAALLRGVPARALVPGDARHHRPDLRDLPGRLPDERGERARAALRRRGARADPDAPPDALLRRVDRESRAPRLHAPRTRLPRLRRCRGARAGCPAGRRAGPRAQEDRQRADDAPRRPRDPPDQRPCRRLLPRPEQTRAPPPARAARTGQGGSARDRSLDRDLRLPGAEGRVRPGRALAPRPTTRSSAAASARMRGSTSTRSSTTSTSTRSTSSGRTRSTRACATAAPTSAGRLPATR